MPYSVAAVPLNRPDVRRFLLPESGRTTGQDDRVPATVEIIDQRPTTAAVRTWARKLDATPRSDENGLLNHLLSIDSPHAHLTTVSTTRLVPVQFLREPGFLTRNLGGWAPVYFAVIGSEEEPSSVMGSEASDPFLRHAKVLKTYGETIDYFGAHPESIAERLQEEAGASLRTLADGVVRLQELDQEAGLDPVPQVPRLVTAIDGAAPLTTGADEPIPEPLLCDALLDRMVRVEQARREADARGDAETMESIAEKQRTWSADFDVQLILKGEYIAGRHRRSTICIAPSLGVVIKQPGPEPFHDIDLNAHTHDGEPENWPTLMQDGAVVTSRGRVRIVLKEGVVPPLHAAFDHGVRFSSLLGLIIEDHVPGPTLQEFISEDPRRLTSDIYRQVLLTQQVCEELGANNPDWHSANFIIDRQSRDLVHIDWGAARPLDDHEHAEEAKTERVDQVRNIAYSFQSDDLSRRASELHDDITGNPGEMQALRQKAEELVQDL